VRQAFAGNPAVADLELLLAIPEHQVRLPGGGRASQTDLWVLAKDAAGLCSIAVEGKVAEPFGPTVGEWLHEASPGKLERLAFLQAELGLTGEISRSIRYQLLHRTVSAVLEARRFGARRAMLLVHSFSQEHLWFNDYAAFAEALGVSQVRVGEVLAARELPGGMDLYVGWVCGNPSFLSA
jgi:hypothetical protein